MDSKVVGNRTIMAKISLQYVRDSNKIFLSALSISVGLIFIYKQLDMTYKSGKE
jgi:hypothetical protein